MQDGLTFNLLFTAAVAFGLCLFFLRRELPFPVSLGIVTVRISLAVLYFALFYAGSEWHFNDDFGYLQTANQLKSGGYTPLNTLTTVDGFAALFDASGGNHLLYRWWNLFAISTFGDYYYAPVFLNIVLSVVGGIYFRRTLRAMGYSENYQQGYLCFFLLQWDIMAWATVANMKEPMTMTLTAAAFCFLTRLTVKRTVRDGLGLFVVLVLVLFLRFYLSLLILSTLAIWMLIEWKDKRKFLFAPLIFLFAYKVASVAGGETSQFLHPDKLLFGILRFPLTPQPWQIAPAFSFLFFPSVIHWLLLPATLWAGVQLWKSLSRARLILIYLLVMTVFFALVPEVQDPRHRVQITFMLAWMQFHAIYLWLQRRRNREIQR